MWTALARGGLAMAVLAFMMQVLRWILDPILDIATSGPNADAETVVQIGGYFNALTVENLTLIAGVGVGLFLLGRAATERRLVR
jgi:hypothetical protein